MRDYAAELEDRMAEIEEQEKLNGNTASIIESLCKWDLDKDYQDTGKAKFLIRLGYRLLAGTYTSKTRRDLKKQIEKELEDELAQQGIASKTKPKKPKFWVLGSPASREAYFKLVSRNKEKGRIYVPSVRAEMDLLLPKVHCTIANDEKLRNALAKPELLRSEEEKELIRIYDGVWTQGRFEEAIKAYENQIEGFTEFVGLLRVIYNATQW